MADFSRIKNVEKIAEASKISRMLSNPFKYLYAIFFRSVIYKNTKSEKEVSCKTFFGTDMHIYLPSSIDIYLTGGKSHDSEIRLAKFLIENLKAENTFLDVGAHYGYFSLLGAKLVEDAGVVYSFEASPTTFKILAKNKEAVKNLNCYNLAVSNEETELTFHEFPNHYSEYNTLDVSQFENEDWYASNQPKKIVIQSVILDDFLKSIEHVPQVIKIDVEGAEFKVIDGMKEFLNKHSPLVVMEYLAESRGNEEHRKAEALLLSLDYASYKIGKDGQLISENNIHGHINSHGLESDNIVFRKKKG